MTPYRQPGRLHSGLESIKLPAVLFAFGLGLAPPAATAQQSPPPPSVTVTAVRSVDVADLRERVGQVEAIEDVEIRARIEGFLEERAFEEGSDVEKGTRLFVIEREPYEAEVQRVEAELVRAQAALKKTELDLVRAERLRRDGNISQAELDAAQANRDQANADVLAHQAELRRARLDLSYTDIRAPITGRIGRSLFSVGDLVGPESGALTTLAQLDPIHVYWTVSEEVVLDFRRANIARLGTGEAPLAVTAELRFADGSAYPYTGQWNFLDNRVDPSTGTQTARAVFPNPDKLLLPGQYVSVVVQVGESAPALVIPQSAVQEDIQGRFVLVVDDQDVVSIRRVTMGARQGINWVVREGLAKGERVIYQGVQKARPGSKVAPMTVDPKAPTD